MVILLLLHSHLDFVGQMAQIEPLKKYYKHYTIKIKENMNQILLIGNLPSKNRHAWSITHYKKYPYSRGGHGLTCPSPTTTN